MYIVYQQIMVSKSINSVCLMKSP